jgi:hypothetical protein
MSQQNITTLQSAINTQLADNTSGDISAADVRNNLINMTDSLLFNSGSQGITGSLTADSFTGSLQGTATTASYVVTAQTASYFSGTVTSASFASTASYIPVAQTLVDANLPLVLINGNSLVKDQYDSIAYNPLNNLLTVGANTDFTGPITSLSSISSTGGFTGSLQGTATTASYALTASMLLGSVTSASYALTSSLSNETIGAGDPTTYPAGGEIQFKGGSGLGSPEGRNTWSSAFIWNPFSNGLTIGDPNTSYVDGSYTLATGYDSIANGNYSVSHGSSSYANGEGSFSHGKLVTAVGSYSHAEGQSSIATGDYSHAEGNSTEAIGQSSHAEGQFTISQGNGSHAEGVSTTAVGPFSHAEGIGTVASGSFQHVGGRYNTQGDTTSLFIIGNGNVDTEVRRDAFKVRMSGSIILPTTSSGQPSWTGTDGEIIAGTAAGGAKVLWVYLGGTWLTSSLGI